MSPSSNIRAVWANSDSSQNWDQLALGDKPGECGNDTGDDEVKQDGENDEHDGEEGSGASVGSGARLQATAIAAGSTTGVTALHQRARPGHHSPGVTQGAESARGPRIGQGCRRDDRSGEARGLAGRPWPGRLRGGRHGPRCGSTRLRRLRSAGRGRSRRGGRHRERLVTPQRAGIFFECGGDLFPRHSERGNGRQRQRRKHRRVSPALTRSVTHRRRRLSAI
ncbi:MAG: hypothetical protein QOG46_230 [Pseudonocardiales bacterium]|nr:hypothetical protein [Pseudonocardiales bacterium]